MSAPRYRLREGVMVQLDLPQGVLLDSRGGEYFELDGAGTVIVRALLAGGTREAAVAAVLAAFEVDAARAAHDADAFIGELLGRGLLEVADG
jgi:hypothetical protein